jgi:hypothetical protein
VYRLNLIVFPKRGRKEIAVEAGSYIEPRGLQRKLYQEAKQKLRMPLEEDERKTVFGKVRRGGLKACKRETCPGSPSFIQVAGSV